MKELDALITALNEKGVIDALKRAIENNLVPKEIEDKQEATNDAVKACLCEYFMKHKKISDLFIEFSVELGLDALVKELDIKPSTKQNKPFSDMLHELIDDLFKK